MVGVAPTEMQAAESDSPDARRPGSRQDASPSGREEGRDAAPPAHEEGSLLPFDAPVELRALLRPEERALLESARRDLGCGLAVLDSAGEVVLGAPPPPAARAAEPEAEPLKVGCDGATYLCAALFHDGDRLALLVAGPLGEDRADPAAEARARFLLRTAEVLLDGALGRTMSARVHLASVEEGHFELRRKNERLEQALQRMQELDRIKANFLATISHELRTPLTSVIGYSEMLMEGLAGPLNDEQREYLRTVMDKGEQLLGLITGILDISRMEAAGVQIHRGPVDVLRLVRDVVATVTPQARRKMIDVQTELPPGPLTIEADADKLRQALLNLTGNAVKFTPQGGEVRVTAAVLPPAPGDGEGRGELRLSVADTGIGIPAHLHEKVFDPFYQVDNSSTREYEGTGLGLSIVRRFIEAHGGRVWIEGRPQGVVFHLSLPLG